MGRLITWRVLVFAPLPLALVYLVLLLVVLLYPYRFSLSSEPNAVRWNPGVQGWQFRQASVLRSGDAPAGLYRALAEGSGISVVVAFTSARVHQYGPARMVSLSVDPWHRNLTVGQFGSRLVVRMRTSAGDLNGTRAEIHLHRVVRPGRSQIAVLTYDTASKTTRIYIDGQMRYVAQALAGDLTAWDASYPLLLGNEASGFRQWWGTINYLALYNRALTVAEAGAVQWPLVAASRRTANDAGLIARFQADVSGNSTWQALAGLEPRLELVAPPRVETDYRRLLRAPYSEFFDGASSRELADTVANVVLFLPLGALLLVGLRRRWSAPRVVVVVLTIGASATLGAEVLQYFIAVRHSSLSDVSNNMLGLIIGMAIASLWGRQKMQLPASQRPGPV